MTEAAAGTNLNPHGAHEDGISDRQAFCLRWRLPEPEHADLSALVRCLLVAAAESATNEDKELAESYVAVARQQSKAMDLIAGGVRYCQHEPAFVRLAALIVVFVLGSAVVRAVGGLF